MDPFFSSIPVAPPPPSVISGVAPPFAPNLTPATTTVAGGPPPSFDHPSYSDMICEAITALKEANGSSKRAIAKYIESAHKDLPPTHSALLTHHLKRLKNNGILIMVKKSYKLASHATRSEVSIPDSAPLNPPDASTGLKRSRGRPPKPKLPIPAAAVETIPAQLQPAPEASFPDVAKRPPGRPRKNGTVVQLGIRKGRGRPPKTGPKKSPGRPKKPKTVRSVVGANAIKRGRGRPPKAVNQLPQPVAVPIQGQPVAVPYADTTDATTAIADSPRPRGRPKGTVVAAAAGVTVPGKGRGRPPKIGGVAAKPRKSTGKPVGRPKKTSGGEASYADLKRKLEFFQSKVKEAVEVLKSQFSSESNISTIDAIQELEGLAAMDIGKSFKDDSQLSPEPTQPAPVPQNGVQLF